MGVSEKWTGCMEYSSCLNENGDCHRAGGVSRQGHDVSVPGQGRAERLGPHCGRFADDQRLQTAAGRCPHRADAARAADGRRRVHVVDVPPARGFVCRHLWQAVPRLHGLAAAGGAGVRCGAVRAVHAQTGVRHRAACTQPPPALARPAQRPRHRHAGVGAGRRRHRHDQYLGRLAAEGLAEHGTGRDDETVCGPAAGNQTGVDASRHCNGKTSRPRHGRGLRRLSGHRLCHAAPLRHVHVRRLALDVAPAETHPDRRPDRRGDLQREPAVVPDRAAGLAAAALRRLRRAGAETAVGAAGHRHHRGLDHGPLSVAQTRQGGRGQAGRTTRKGGSMTQPFGTIWTAPIVLGVLTIVGLISALVGDGIWDALSAVTLGMVAAQAGPGQQRFYFVPVSVRRVPHRGGGLESDPVVVDAPEPARGRRGVRQSPRIRPESAADRHRGLASGRPGARRRRHVFLAQGRHPPDQAHRRRARRRRRDAQRAVGRQRQGGTISGTRAPHPGHAAAASAQQFRTDHHSRQPVHDAGRQSRQQRRLALHRPGAAPSAGGTRGAGAGVGRLPGQLGAAHGARAELVAVRVAHIGQPEGARRGVAWTRRRFDRLPAQCHGGVVELLYLFGGGALETDGGAIGDGGRFIVDRFADGQAVAFVPVEQPYVPGWRDVANGFARAERAEDGVVKLLRAVDVVGADHDVVEHGVSVLSWLKQHGSATSGKLDRGRCAVQQFANPLRFPVHVCLHDAVLRHAVRLVRPPSRDPGVADGVHAGLGRRRARADVRRAARMPRAARAGRRRRLGGGAGHRPGPLQRRASAEDDVAHHDGVRPGAGHRADHRRLAASGLRLARHVRLPRRVRRPDGAAVLEAVAGKPAGREAPCFPPWQYRAQLPESAAPSTLPAAVAGRRHGVWRLVAVHRFGRQLRHADFAPAGNGVRVDVHPVDQRDRDRLGVGRQARRNRRATPPEVAGLRCDGGRLRPQCRLHGAVHPGHSVGGAAADGLHVRPGGRHAGHPDQRAGTVPGQPRARVIDAGVHPDDVVCAGVGTGGAAAVRQRLQAGVRRDGGVGAQFRVLAGQHTFQTGLTTVRLHRGSDFALGVAVLLGGALVVLFFTLGQADFAFHAPALEVQVERHQRETGALDLADQFVELGAVQQQLARADGFRMGKGGGGRQRADVGAEQK
ncbi:unnamed protein product [Rhizophagus irregularis]|nr:unnamed protein product [Rhizophagus irregularis]